MKLASITVAYRMDPDKVAENMHSYADGVDVLILWDNSEYLDNDWSSMANDYPGMILMQSGVNVGLAEAYNRGAEIARQHGCTHLMTMDQDSAFENFASYRAQIEHCTDERTGIFVSPINVGNNWPESPVELGWAVQSSSTFRLDMLERIGGFRKDLFIDMVDTEVSLRCVEKGYRIMQLANCNLVHSLGDVRVTSFLGIRVTVSDYSPLRQYYQSRNGILMWHQFPYAFSLCDKVHWFAKRLHYMAKILLVEDGKCAKIAALVRGIHFGLRNESRPYR